MSVGRRAGAVTSLLSVLVAVCGLVYHAAGLKNWWQQLTYWLHSYWFTNILLLTISYENTSSTTISIFLSIIFADLFKTCPDGGTNLNKEVSLDTVKIMIFAVQRYWIYNWGICRCFKTRASHTLCGSSAYMVGYWLAHLSFLLSTFRKFLHTNRAIIQKMRLLFPISKGSSNVVFASERHSF